MALSVLPEVAWAQSSDADKASARELLLSGLQALEKKDFATAAEQFSRGEALYHAPTLLLGLARARRGLGQLVAAEDAYSRVATSSLPSDASDAFRQALVDARAELAEIRLRVPAVTILVKGPATAKVTIDGAPVPSAALGVPRFVDPGKHTIRGAARGFTAVEATITLAEGKKEQLTLELKPKAGESPDDEPSAGAQPQGGPGGKLPAPPAKASPLKTLGFVGLGVGAAGLVVGGIAGGLALGKHSDISKQCPGGSCPSNAGSALRGDVDSLHTLALASDVAFGVGGALAAAGLVLVLTGPKANRSTGAIRPLVGLGFVGAEGTFQ